MGFQRAPEPPLDPLLDLSHFRRHVFPFREVNSADAYQLTVCSFDPDQMDLQCLQKSRFYRTRVFIQ